MASTAPIMKPGEHLADQYFQRSHGGNQQLVEGSGLSFAGHRKGGHQHGNHEGQQPDDPRDDKPAALEVGIEPGPDFQAGG